MNAADGTESARYETGPFAEPLRTTGPMAKVNPLRFSTQYADDVTGDVKYLYRDLDVGAGHWLSRDPIEERGGRNLYAFVGNRPVSHADVLGMFWAPSVAITDEGTRFPYQRISELDQPVTPGMQGKTESTFPIYIKKVHTEACCCRLVDADYEVWSKMTLYRMVWNPKTSMHEDAHRKANNKMGEWAIEGWIAERKRKCIGETTWVVVPGEGWLGWLFGHLEETPVPMTESRCRALLMERARKLQEVLWTYANGPTSILGTKHHEMIATNGVGWTAAGEATFMAWLDQWLKATFPRD